MSKKYFYVYKTTNLINGKIYVGKHSSNKIDDTYLGSGKKFNNAIKKYGKENFKREILEFCDSIEILNEREIFWIKELNSKNETIGYNLADGGNGVCGYTHSIESRNKMSVSKKGKNSGKDSHRWGIKASVETKLRLRESHLGIRVSEESKIKMSKTRQEKGVWNKGKKNCFTEETLKKMSSNRKGIKLSEEHINKLRFNFLGKHHSQESIDKLKQKRKLQPPPMPKGFKRNKLICPYCGKEGGDSVMKRWHFEKCRYKR